jgi:hypothetical protein
MKTNTLVSIVAVLVALTLEIALSCKIDSSSPDLMRDVVAPYVEVLSVDNKCIGAGTVIRTSRGKVYILTAGHVATAVEQNKMHIRKVAEKGAVYQTWITKTVKVDFDENIDLALLEPFNPEGLSAAFYTGQEELCRGQDCWYIGTNGGIHSSLERSILNQPFFRSAYDDYKGDEDYPKKRDAMRIMFNGNCYYGNSGGGLYVKGTHHYVLVGVVVELARGGEKAPSMAVPQEYINSFLSGE